MTNLLGQSLGRYHIIEQLGEGGMATVYKAYDKRLERDVAIKMIRRGAFPAEHLDQILKRFDRESKALAKLFHPNIVKVLDDGEYEGSPYMVLEYLPGGTLKQRLGKPIPWKDSINLLLPIVKALEYAHGQGIVHRDLKPSNILLTKNNQPLLTDFGIAKILETRELTTLTGTGVGVGTPEYMAPEQWTGKADTRSDIYSMGVVLYEMITGRKPYMADTPAAILLKQATEPLPRPTQYVPDLSAGVERILIKALSREPENRFQSMAEFAAAMEKGSIGRQAETPNTKATVTFPAANETSATIAQEDSRATRYQGTTRDTMSASRVRLGESATVDAFPQGSVKKGFPTWGIAAIGGLVIIGICISIAFAIGILGDKNPPAVYEHPSTAAPISNPINPTKMEPQPNPTDAPVFPTEPPAPVLPDPSEFIYWYFEKICSDRNYKEMWSEYQTKAFRQTSARNDYQGYVNFYNTVDWVEVISVRVQSNNGSTAFVEVDLVFHMNAGWNDSATIEYKLIYNESKGHWLFDSNK